MDNDVATNRNPADEDEEEEDDWNPEAEVGSDNEDEPSKIEQEAAPSPKKSQSRSQSEMRRSHSAAGSRRQSAAPEPDAISDAGKSESRRGSDTALDKVEADTVNGDAGEDAGQDAGENVGDDEEEEDADKNEDDAEEGQGDEEDEEEDEDEDEDEQVQDRHSKKRRKRNRNQFIDVEAEVDEEDEEEDEEDDLPEGFVADEHPDDEALPPGEIADDRTHRLYDQQRQRAEDFTAEQVAEQYAKKYKDYGRNRGPAMDTNLAPQRLLLPSVDDPSIWGVKCKPGKEREVVFAIQKRIEQRIDSPKPLKITSAFERGGTMAGFIYVEAKTKAHAREAVDGLTSVFLGKDMLLVPIPEMPDLLRTRKSKTIDPGNWVRIKRGKYQGDLAHVEEVHENGLEVTLKIVPREDYGNNEDTNAPMASGLDNPVAKRKRTNAFGKSNVTARPPPRLFNENEARKRHGRYLQQVDNLSSKKFQYQGNLYEGGFLIKVFKVNQLHTEDVNPTLEEVSKFTIGQEEGADTLDLQKLAATLKQSSADSYLPGDAVEIFSGEQRGVVGKAVSVRGEIATIRVTEGELVGQSVDAPVKDLRKRFREGDHVKVIGGSKYIDEVGMVVRIMDTRVTLLGDASNTEITVFSKDLRAATDAGSSKVGSKYDLHDLVQLDQSTVGVVTKVDRESLRILDQNGTSRTLLPSAIAGKIERRRMTETVSIDKDGTEVRNDDTVKEVGGDQRQGRVMHVHRSFLFIHSRSQTDNAGIFVARSSGVLTVAASGARGNHAGPDLTKMNPTTQRPGVADANGQMAPPKTMGRDRMLGKSCTIKKGPYKGLFGIIKDTSETHARVELHTKSKVVSVPKENLAIKDPFTGNTIDVSRFGGPPRNHFNNPAVPTNGRFSGGATPGPWNADGYAGGRTPAGFGAGGKTPAWGAPSWGGATAYGGVGGGGKTPGWQTSARSGQATWGAGGRTPAPFNDGSRTQYGGWGDGSKTAYGGGRTPGWAMDGGKTPAPHMFDASAPAADKAAPGWARPYGSATTGPNDDGYE